jgi:hypothetical protein
MMDDHEAHAAAMALAERNRWLDHAYGGDCTISDRIVPETSQREIHLDHADPRIQIAEDFLNEIRGGHHHPGVALDGDLLKIRATNRTVIYRIGIYTPDRKVYTAEWPD